MKTLARTVALSAALAAGAAVGAARAEAGPAPSAGTAASPFARPARIAYLREALATVEATDPARLARARDRIATLTRSACTSAFERLRVECVLAVARRYCAGQGERHACEVVADVVAADALAEDHFLPPTERYLLLQKSRDPRRAVAEALERMRGDLAVDLRLSGPRCEVRDLACMAERIDDFCGSASDARNLPWQACAGALVWFIGTQRDPAER